MRMPSGPKNNNENLVAIPEDGVLVGAIRGDVHEFYEVWKDRRKVKTLTYAEGLNYEAVNGEKMNWKFRVNFFKKTDLTKPLILEAGWGVWKFLAESKKMGYTLDRTWFGFSKKGKGMETKYSVVPAPSGSITPEELNQIEAAPLHNLAPPMGNVLPPAFTETDIPF